MTATSFMKRLATVAAVSLLPACLGADRARVAAAGPVVPAIPSPTFSIADEGAATDGKTLSTGAIQKAIDKAGAAGGGTVLIPPGTYVSGPIRLKSGIDLHLAKGATLRMSANVDDFPANRNGRENFITADDAHDVQISGEGVIDGQGEPWWDAFRKLKGTSQSAPRRPQMIRFSKCNRVRLAGFTTQNPPNTHCSMSECTDVIIEGLTMTAPGESPNTDALNLRVRNAVIRRCSIATGDDNIVLLASGPGNSKDAVVENVTISDCKLGVGHGLSIGSYTSGGIRNVTAEDVTFDGTTSGIRMKAGRDRGGLVEHITYRNIAMKNVKYPVWLSSYYPKEPKSPTDDTAAAVGASTPRWQHISIENLTATGASKAVTIWGVPEQPFADVSLKNVWIAADTGATVINAKAVRFENVVLDVRKGPPLTTWGAEVQGTTPLKPAGTGRKDQH